MRTKFNFWTVPPVIITICAIVLLGSAASAQTGPENPDAYICQTATYPVSYASGGGNTYNYCQPPAVPNPYGGCTGQGSVTIKLCVTKCNPRQEVTGKIVQTVFQDPGLAELSVPIAIPGPTISLQLPTAMFAGQTYAGSVSSDLQEVSSISISAPAPFRDPAPLATYQAASFNCGPLPNG
jgi:hypothetical protein